MRIFVGILAVSLVTFVGIFLLRNANQFKLPSGTAIPLGGADGAHTPQEQQPMDTNQESTGAPKPLVSARQIFVTDGVKHSIPIGEILSGGVAKDGIPSIDDPKFISPKEADTFLTDDDVGLGFVWKGEERFYPYQILVFHEIVNDTVAGDAILVTYCPLCATGVVFDRTVNDAVWEFGVSGRLWQSNLLMYNRTEDPSEESFWSQVLGEAVLGEETGTKLAILRADTVRYGDWKSAHPQTTVLSRDTGEVRAYGRDPYGDYYTDNFVSFGATFSDNRLHPKAFVLGVEIDGAYKAYESEALPEGTTTDTFAGTTITIEKNSIGEVSIFEGKERTPLSFIGGFWFSWLAVHPQTELYKQ